MPFKSKEEKRAYDARYYQEKQGGGQSAPKAGGYSVVSETAKAFRVRHPSGKVFNVAKAGLSQRTTARIKGFEQGGVVHAADGVEVFDPADPTTADAQTVDQSVPYPTAVPMDEMVQLATPKPWYEGAYNAAEAFEAGALGPATGGAAPAALKLYRTAVPKMAERAVDKIEGAVAGAIAKPEQAAPAPVAPTEPPSDQIGTLGRGAMALTSMGPVGVSAPKLSDAAQMDPRAGVAKREEAIEGQRDAAMRFAEEKMAEEGDVRDFLASHGARVEAMVAERSAKSKQMQDDIAAYKIDPSHYWADASTGQKVVAAISVFLGGMGAGKGPNQALAQINKYVDDDIAAQKAELGKKQNQLGQYLDETKDLRVAMDMVKADKLAVAASQMRTLGAKFEGGTAAAVANEQAARLEEHAAQLNFNNANAVANQHDKQAMTDFQARLFNATQRAAYEQRTMAAKSQLSPLTVLDSDGKERVANNDEAKKLADEKVAAYRDFLDKAKAVQALVSSDPRGIWNPARTDKGTAEAAVGSLRLAYQTMIKGTPSDKDQKLIDRMIPMEIVDPSAKAAINPKFIQAKLDALVLDATRGKEAVLTQYTKPWSFYTGPAPQAIPASNRPKILPRRQ